LSALTQRPFLITPFLLSEICHSYVVYDTSLLIEYIRQYAYLGYVRSQIPKLEGDLVTHAHTFISVSFGS
jgi:hypothetical protein